MGVPEIRLVSALSTKRSIISQVEGRKIYMSNGITNQVMRHVKVMVKNETRTIYNYFTSNISYNINEVGTFWPLL